MRKPHLLVILAVVLLFAIQLAAQSTFATLTGTVTDASGAVIPLANIEATHTETNYVYTAQSNESGVYVLAQLRVRSRSRILPILPEVRL